MVRCEWVRTGGGRRLYLFDSDFDLIKPVKLFLDYLDATSHSPNTLKNYCRHLGLYFLFLEQVGVGWKNATPDTLAEFLFWLRSPHRSAAVLPIRGRSVLTERSVNTVLTAVCSFYRYHIQRGEDVVNPVLFESIPDRFSRFKPFLVHASLGKTRRRKLSLKEPMKRPKTVSPKNFEKFVSCIDNRQFRCLVFLLLEGGLRVGQALGLLIQDVESFRGGVWIRQRDELDNQARSKNMVNGEERFLDLPASVMKMLDELILDHSYDTDHVFVVQKKGATSRSGQSTYGRPLTAAAVRSLFLHYSQRSGVYIHPHMLRHTHLTDLVRSGWDAAHVQARAGHKQVQTTMGLYVHLSDEDLAKAYRTFEEANRRGKQTT